MADEADKGNEAAELFLAVALTKRQSAVIPAGVGFCLNCSAAVEGDRRWCDDECKEDHQRYGRGH